MSSKLILMRHGRSSWNRQNIFTGCVDIPLDEKGVEEAIAAGNQIKDIPIDVIYTSTLIRAQMTVVLALMNHSSGKVPVFVDPQDIEHADWAKIHCPKTELTTIPAHRHWELNERYYGDLQGMNKAEMTAEFGENQVQLWRRSFTVKPPNGESLEDTAARTLPFFEKAIVPYIKNNQTVFIAAHGNSLRSIIMELEKISKEDIVSLEIPTGIPMIYTYEQGRWLKST
jgi:2,3-bisphosphoglycerate-dependent phosphoglycerate mutase